MRRKKPEKLGLVNLKGQQPDVYRIINQGRARNKDMACAECYRCLGEGYAKANLVLRYEGESEPMVLPFLFCIPCSEQIPFGQVPSV